MSTTQSPYSPMEVVTIKEDEDTTIKEDKLDKKPEGSRKDLGKT